MTHQATEQLNLFDLADQWRAAKRDEDQANIRRVEIEKQMITAAAFIKLEGSESHKSDTKKVTFTAKLTKKLDVKKWLSVKGNIPEAFRSVVKEKSVIEYKLDDKGVKYLESNEPDIFAILSEALTITPAKTAVKVELL
jgi:hypothetical protein